PRFSRRATKSAMGKGDLLVDDARETPVEPRRLPPRSALAERREDLGRARPRRARGDLRDPRLQVLRPPRRRDADDRLLPRMLVENEPALAVRERILARTVERVLLEAEGRVREENDAVAPRIDLEGVEPAVAARLHLDAVAILGAEDEGPGLGLRPCAGDQAPERDDDVELAAGLVADPRPPGPGKGGPRPTRPPPLPA